MGRSRYSSCRTLPGNYLETWRDAVPIEEGILDGLRVEEYTTQAGDRLDRLAHFYYNDETYWWAIAHANGISWALGIPPGTRLLVPLDIAEYLRRVVR